MSISSRSALAAHALPAAAAAAANVAAFGLPAALGPAFAAKALPAAGPLDDLRVSDSILELLDREFREKLGGRVEHQPVDAEISKLMQVQLTLARVGGLEVVLIQIPASILRDGNEVRRLLVLSYVLRDKTVRLFAPDLEGEPTSAFNGLKSVWKERENIDIEFVPRSHLEELRQGTGDLGNVLKLDLHAGARPGGGGGAGAGPAPVDPAAKGRIRLFLASSQELRDDRDEFELYLRQLNDQFAKQGRYFEIRRWENFLDAMSETRLQDEYNKAVRDCDIFVSLFFTKTGKYTEEEFDTAHDQFKTTGKPRIYTFFKNAPVNMGEIGEEVLSLLTFKKKLSNLGHFHTQFDNIEHLKRQFRDQIDRLILEKKI